MHYSVESNSMKIKMFTLEKLIILQMCKLKVESKSDDRLF